MERDDPHNYNLTLAFVQYLVAENASYYKEFYQNFCKKGNWNERVIPTFSTFIRNDLLIYQGEWWLSAYNSRIK